MAECLPLCTNGTPFTSKLVCIKLEQSKNTLHETAYSQLFLAICDLAKDE